MNKETYLKLIKEDIEWLLKNTERTLERDHIIVIIKESILQHYPNEEPIDEDKLDELAIKNTPRLLIEENDGDNEFQWGFKVGYKKAKGL